MSHDHPDKTAIGGFVGMSLCHYVGVSVVAVQGPHESLVDWKGLTPLW